MNTITLRLLTCLLLAVGLPVVINAEVEKTEAEVGKESLANRSFKDLVVVIPIREKMLTDRASVRIFRDLVAKIEEDGAAAVVFDIDVSEGEIQEAGEWTDTVAGLGVPTVAFVNRNASGEAVALSCASDRIFMVPGAQIGLAPPSVANLDPSLSEAAQKEIMANNKAKVIALVASLCGRKGHDAEVARAFVDSGWELERGGEIISEKGELLSLSAEQATRVVDGKPIFAEKLISDVEGVAAELGDNLKTLTVSLLQFERDRDVKPFLKDTTDGNLVATDSEGRPLAGSGVSREKDLLPGEESYKGKIVVIKIDEDDLMNRARFAFFDRTVNRASEEGATAVIFDINTPGGLAWETVQLMVGALQKAKCPTFAYCNPAAISAGALISCACDKIYMAPGGQIGAALIVSAGGDMGENQQEKADSGFAAFARSAVERKPGRYRKDVVMSFMILEHELIIDGEVIDPADDVLTLSAQEATRLYDGEPLLAEGIVDSISELTEKEGLSGEIIYAEPLGMERFAELVAAFAGILIMVGLAGGYIEFNSPGFGLPGLVSVTAFTIFFIGHFMAGSLVGYEAVVVVVLGLILLVVEFFFIPGTMVTGALGLLLVVGGLIYTMAGLDWGIVEGESAPRDFSAYGSPIMNVAIGFGGAVILIGLLMRYLPETSLFRWMVLENSVGGKPVLAGGGISGADGSTLIGRTGVAKTALKPSGKGLIGDAYLDIVSDGTYVSEGEAIRVIRQEGNRIVVEKVG